MTFFTSRLESSVVVAIFSTNCDLDIWVAIVSPLIRTESILDCPASVWSHSAQICWHFEAVYDEKAVHDAKARYPQLAADLANPPPAPRQVAAE
jgi:hypothetical protein